MIDIAKIIITTAKGLVPYLADEVLGLEYPVRATSTNHVETEGSLSDAMRLNLWLSTAFHVLYHLKSFPCKTPDELYQGVYEFPWEEWLFSDKYLSITSTVDNPEINDSRFPNLRCKDGIVDRLRDKTGMRPDSGPDASYAVVRLFWKTGTASLFIDTSGEPLTRRGYRKIPWQAPMQETLAASLVLASGWNGKGNFVNPMCGSGTLAIEAALIGLNRAPGLLRSNFGFKHIRGYNEPQWQAIRKRAHESALKIFPGKIIASDISQEAIDAAIRNATTAGVDQLIEFIKCDFAETPIPDSEGVVLLNPEYGLRLGDHSELPETYRRIGDFFKKKCSGYRGFVFSGNMELLKKIGLKPCKRLHFYNAKIECRLFEYELYSGTRSLKTRE